MARKKLSKRLQRKIAERSKKIWRVVRDPAAKFTIYVKPKNGGPNVKPWHEDWVVETKDPEQWAVEMVANFNANRVEGEPERQLVYVVPRGRGTPKIHVWKRTSPSTILADGCYMDTFQCKRCKITAHRSGLFGPIERDPRYSAMIYVHCDTAAGAVERESMQSSRDPKDRYRNHQPPIKARREKRK